MNRTISDDTNDGFSTAFKQKPMEMLSLLKDQDLYITLGDNEEGILLHKLCSVGSLVDEILVAAEAARTQLTKESERTT